MRELTGALAGTCADEPYEEPEEVEDDDEPRVYFQRWIQLAYLAALALLSDWVCFSVAPVYEVWQNQYHRHQSELITIFLFTNVLFCFIEPAVVARWGLRKVVVGSSFLMSVGCMLRSGLVFTRKMPWYWLEILGTVCVGAAQPFFQCTPTLLSAVWFAPDERILATAIAINSNQIGIGVGFIVGPVMADSEETLNVYFSIIACIAVSLSLGVYLQFQEEPPKPPSASAAVRTDSIPTDFPRQIKRMLRTPGFLQPLVTFMASIAITNAISSEAGRQLQELGGSEDEHDRKTQMLIMIGGAGFQMAIMFGSVILGKIVDATKWYKGTVCLLMVSTMCLLVTQACVNSVIPFLAALFALGSCVGPVQPISAELAVEVAFPLDENAIVALQQVCGNLFSAMSLPVLSKATELELHMPGARTMLHIILEKVCGYAFHIMLEFICVGGLLYFATFGAPLKRAEIDAKRKTHLSTSLELEGYLPMATSPVVALRAHGFLEDAPGTGMEPLLDKGSSFRFSHSHSAVSFPQSHSMTSETAAEL
mmetsp:Transcript_62552/g.116309  ORF Transcript_62552/g.116309 Transcript_62552/m.116309 type:complete len:537 (-) Transcript_62552:114-1724(-)